MIVLNVLCKDESRISEITNYLKENRFALETFVDINRLVDGENEQTFIRIFFITKSLLFEMICKDLMLNFKDDGLTIYSSPVTQIETGYWNKLKEHLKAV